MVAGATAHPVWDDRPWPPCHPHHHRGCNYCSCRNRWSLHLQAVFRSLNYLVTGLTFKVSETQTKFRSTDSLSEQRSTVLLIKVFIDPYLQPFGARLSNVKKAPVFCNWNGIFNWFVLYLLCFILHRHKVVVFGRCFFCLWSWKKNPPEKPNDD